MKAKETIREKNRKIKTIQESFGVNENINSKDDIYKLLNELKIRFNEYYKVCGKVNKAFNIEDALQDLNIFYKGIFYLTALGKYEENTKYPKGIFKNDKWIGYVDYGDSYPFHNDDESCKRTILKSNFKKGDKEYMEYVKYFVMDSSTNGWSLVLHNYPKDEGYDFIITKNDILLEGNIGTYIS